MFEDERARIPFSVIGIFLILGSSFTAVYVTKLETEEAEEISQTIGFNEIEIFLRLAEADMATALNLAGLKGLKEIGERPVMNVLNAGQHDLGDDAGVVNRNRVKSIILDDMNVYLNNSYRYDVFNNGRYAINVVVTEGEQYPIISRDEITFSYVDMELKRDFTIDAIGPPDSKTHRTYWVAHLPVEVEIVQLDGDSAGEIVTNRTIDVSTLITCRYNLLKKLVEEFNDEIDGTPCSLWTVCTVLFNIYSLARGYQHWGGGDPANVVDNEHLHPMVNSGLLLQQGFVFGSVDPMALVELAVSMSGSSSDLKDDIYSSFEHGDPGWDIDTSSVSSVLPSGDNGNPDTPKLDISLDIDISGIASMPLYNCSSVILTFINNNGVEEKIILNDPSDADISNKVEEKINQGYTHINTEKNEAATVKNQSTVNKIKNIVSTVYTADMKTQVDRGPEDIVEGVPPASFTIDNGTAPWIYNSYILTDTIDKPSKGNVVPGCILYGEQYDVEYSRSHYWSKQNADGSWEETTVTDTKHEDVTIKIVLVEYSNYDSLKNDVKDVFYENTVLNDENLEDTIDTYKNQVLTVDNIKKWLEASAVGGEVDTSSVQGSYNSWVETEARQSLDGILEDIKKIELDPSITSSRYPDPVNLMNAAKDDLLRKYDENMSGYLNENAYKDGSLFKSTGKKAVFCVRKWYVDKVHSDIDNYFSSAENEINKHMNDALDDSDAAADDVHDVLSGESMSRLQNQFTIPMGYDISLKSDWNEKIRLAVDQKPDYLKPNEKIAVSEEENNDKDEEFYPLKLRNLCTLGPTGFPVLPTPVTPWIFTFNVWYIEVKGEYEEFKVVDTTDETHFNPLIGHEPQIYIRKHEAIKDGDTTIGENTRLAFEFSTASTSFVPPFNFMVGDTAGGLDEQTDGFS